MKKEHIYILVILSQMGVFVFFWLSNYSYIEFIGWLKNFFSGLTFMVVINIFNASMLLLVYRNVVSHTKDIDFLNLEKSRLEKSIYEANNQTLKQAKIISNNKMADLSKLDKSHTDLSNKLGELSGRQGLLEDMFEKLLDFLQPKI